MRRKSTKKSVAPVNPYPIVIETFRQFGSWEARNLQCDTPSAINGHTSFRKYRITVEEIQEPVEVLQERIRKLWEECDNWNNASAIRTAGQSVGLELQHKDFGKNRRK